MDAFFDEYSNKKQIPCECTPRGCGRWVSMTTEEYITIRNIYGRERFKIYHRDCHVIHCDTNIVHRAKMTLTLVGIDYLIYTNVEATKAQFDFLKRVLRKQINYGNEQELAFVLFCETMFNFWR